MPSHVLLLLKSLEQGAYDFFLASEEGFIPSRDCIIYRDSERDQGRIYRVFSARRLERNGTD